MTTVEELKKKHAEELAKAEREDALLKTLENMGAPQPSMVFQHSLYGSEGSIVYGNTFAGYYDKSPFTLQDALEVAEALPPIPLVYVKDGCVSIRSREHVDSIPEEKKEQWQQEEDIGAVKIEADGFGVNVKWETRIGDDRWSVCCEFPPHKFRTLHAKAHRVKYRGGFRYDHKTVSVPDTFTPVYAEDEATPLGEARPVRFWSDETSIGNHVVVFSVYGKAMLEPKHVIRALMKAENV